MVSTIRVPLALSLCIYSTSSFCTPLLIVPCTPLLVVQCILIPIPFSWCIILLCNSLSSVWSRGNIRAYQGTQRCRRCDSRWVAVISTAVITVNEMRECVCHWNVIWYIHVTQIITISSLLHSFCLSLLPSFSQRRWYSHSSRQRYGWWINT